MVLSRSWQIGAVCYDREHRQRMIGTVWPGLNWTAFRYFLDPLFNQHTKHVFSECTLKMAYTKCQPFCSGHDVIKWKHFPRYWSSVREIHRSPRDPPPPPPQRPALMFSLIWAWMNGWANNRDAGNLRCHRAHCEITVMINACAAAWVSLCS